jgi:cytochrome c oxidase assembly protein Cox11
MEERRKRSLFDNALVAFFISFLLLSIFGVTFREVWLYLFSVGVAWVVSDFVLNLIIRGGGGIAQIPLWGTQIQTKGRSYLAFVLGIFVATYASSFFSDVFFKAIGFGVATAAEVTLSASQAEWTGIVVSSFMMAVLMLVDFNARFYGRG